MEALMLKTLSALACVAALSATPAMSGDVKSLTYADFEPSVTHLDLAKCPSALAAENTFCRLSIGADALHVFVFSEEGDQPLVGFHSFDEDAYEIVLK
jgi:hypothetical protein